MDIRNVMLYVLAFANLFMITHIGLYSVGANIYDLKKAYKNKKKVNRRPSRQPLVSVLIPAHNEELCIKRTLDSVLSNTYPNLEVIVVDDASTDKTVEKVKAYIKWMPRVGTKHYKPLRWQKRVINQRFLHNPVTTKPVRIYSFSRRGKGGVLNGGISKHAKGELVMCLDGDTILDEKAIETAVSYFKDRRVIGVAANVRIMGGKSWLTVLQRFEHMVGYRSKKFHTINSSEMIIGGVASTYRMSALKKVKFYDTDTMTEDIGLSMKMVYKYGNVKKKIVYASDVIAMTEGVQTYKALAQQRYRWKLGNLQNIFKYRSLIFSRNSKYTKRLTAYRLPVAILSELLLLIEPILIIYLIYLSFYYHTFIVLMGGYVTITLYVFLTLWQDEHIGFLQKIRMSLSAVVVYALFYAMDLVQYSAIVRSLIAHKELFGKKQSIVPWSSPARTGRQATF